MTDTNNDKVVLDRSKYDYQTHKEFRTPSGRAAVDNGDQVAGILRGMSLAGAFETLIANGGAVKPEWEGLNTGMQRMAVGNVLRRLARKLPEGGKLIVPESALATVAKVDLEAKAAAAAKRKEEAEAAKAEKARQAEVAKQAKIDEAAARAKADPEAAVKAEKAAKPKAEPKPKKAA